MIAEIQVGPQILANGVRPAARGDRSAALAVTDAHARFQEAVLNGNVFGLCLTAVTTNPQAGNYLPTSGATAASTNFTIWNPIGSGVNLVLWQFNLGYVSGTPAAGPVWHCLYNAQAVSAAVTGTARNLMGQLSGPHAAYVASAGGVTMTGQQAPYQVCMANFSGTAIAQAVAYPVNTTDLLEGKIIVPQGMGWVPLLAGAGTYVVGFSVVWEEIPS